MTVNVELDNAELLRMVKNGAKYVTQWSVDNNVICYSKSTGYTTGIVL